MKIIPKLQQGGWIQDRGPSGEYGWRNLVTGLFTTINSKTKEKAPTVQLSTTVKKPVIHKAKKQADIAAERAVRERQKRADMGQAAYDTQKDKKQTQYAIAQAQQNKPVTTQIADAIDTGVGFVPMVSDAYDGIKATSEASKGNYGEAAILAGGIFVPSILQKGYRYVKNTPFVRNTLNWFGNKFLKVSDNIPPLKPALEVRDNNDLDDWDDYYYYISTQSPQRTVDSEIPNSNSSRDISSNNYERYASRIDPRRPDYTLIFLQAIPLDARDYIARRYNITRNDINDVVSGKAYNAYGVEYSPDDISHFIENRINSTEPLSFNEFLRGSIKHLFSDPNRGDLIMGKINNNESLKDLNLTLDEINLIGNINKHIVHTPNFVNKESPEVVETTISDRKRIIPHGSFIDNIHSNSYSPLSMRLLLAELIRKARNGEGRFLPIEDEIPFNSLGSFKLPDGRVINKGARAKGPEDLHKTNRQLMSYVDLINEIGALQNGDKWIPIQWTPLTSESFDEYGNLSAMFPGINFFYYKKGGKLTNYNLDNLRESLKKCNFAKIFNK